MTHKTEISKTGQARTGYDDVPVLASGDKAGRPGTRGSGPADAAGRPPRPVSRRPSQGESAGTNTAKPVARLK